MSKDPIEIAAGSVVHAKSGGPRMTVSDIVGDVARTQWFEGTKLQSGRFPVHSLIHEDDIEYSFGA